MQSEEVLQNYREQGMDCERLNASASARLPARYTRGISHPRVTRVRVDADEGIAFLKLESGQPLRWAVKRHGDAWSIGALLWD